MSQVLQVAVNVQTPLSIAALTVLVMLLIFRSVIKRLNLQAIIPADTFKLMMRVSSYTFIIALCGLLVGVSAYIFSSIQLQNKLHSLNKSTIDLSSSDKLLRVSALTDLYSLGSSYDVLVPQVCARLSTFLKTPNAKLIENGIELPSDEAIIALKYISKLSIMQDHHQREMVDLQMSRADLRNINLENYDLSRSKLEETNLSFSQLNNISFVSADLRGAVVKNSALHGANFGGAALSNANFSNSDLTSAYGLRGADLHSVIFDFARLDGVDLREAKLPRFGLKGASLKGTDLRGTNLRLVKNVCRMAIESAVRDGSTLEPESYEC